MSKYKRNPDLVKSMLVKNKSDQILTKVNCKIQVPVRYSTVGLGQVGLDTYILGLFPIILESGDYTVCNVNALVELNPSKVTVVTIDDVEYHEFFFEKETVVIKNTNLVKREDLMYSIFSEFIFKGKIPWFVEYNDLGKLFDTAESHAGSRVNKNLEVIEFIASLITRSKQDRSKYIRNIGNIPSDFSLDKIDYVPLSSIFYSVTNTVNKISGSYFKDGVTSALVNPTTKVEKIEKILRV